MEHPQYLNDVLVFLLAAVLVVSTFRRIHVSPIIGYLIAGLLMGPYAMGFIAEVKGVNSLGELGVVFLLFSIGLKLSLPRLQMMKRYVFGLGSLQVLSCGAALGFIAYYFGQTVEAAVLIGSALALSSTAVGIQIMTEREELATRYGRVSFSVLLFQDLMVVILLVLLTTIGQKDVHILAELGRAAWKAGVVLAIIIAVGWLVLRPVYRAIANLNSPELFVAMTLLVVLTTSVTTHAAGLSMELGAFLAGLLLSETEYRHQIEADIQPFHGLLLGLFFMTVGMRIDIGAVLSNALEITLIISGLLLIKTLLTALMSLILRLPLVAALRVGLLLASGGEFVFVILAPAMDRGLIPADAGQLLFAAVAISMGFTPFLNMLGKLIEDRYTEKKAKATIKSASSEIGDLKNHVIIAGFGRVGQLVAKMLTERMIPFVAIDKNMDTVAYGRSKGLPVFYGDIKRPHVLRAIGADSAKVVVVSINVTSASVKTAMMVRKNFPNTKVCVRMRDDTYFNKLDKEGIEVIMPENLEPSLQLAGSVLNVMGSTTEEIRQALDKFRKTLTRVQEEAEAKEEVQEAS